MGDPPSPPKLSFLGGQEAYEPVKWLLSGGVRALWESEDPLWRIQYYFSMLGVEAVTAFKVLSILSKFLIVSSNIVQTIHFCIPELLLKYFDTTDKLVSIENKHEMCTKLT